MSIGDTIRRYRKERGMTQEEMAGALGVTAPAVNKWERGKSLPDVAMLAPIARLLQISTDTLLGYQRELTDMQIQGLQEAWSSQIKEGFYEAVYFEMIRKIKEYPNCEELILTAAQLLDGYGVMMLSEEEREKYRKEIIGLYKRLLGSQNRDTADQALSALFYKEIAANHYEQAQKYLDRIPKDKRYFDQYQALLYARQGKTEESFELYERLLLKGHSDLMTAFQGISVLAAQTGDLDTAERIAYKQGKLAELLEMGEYMQLSAVWGAAYYRKDPEKVYELLDKMIDAIPSIGEFTKSPLYRHINFPKNKGNYHIANMVSTLQKVLENDEEGLPPFLAGDQRMEKLLEKLEKMRKDLDDFHEVS